MQRVIDLKNKNGQAQIPQTPREEKLERAVPPPERQAETQTPEEDPQFIAWSEMDSVVRPNMKAVFGVAIGLFVLAVLAAIFQKDVIMTILLSLLGGSVIMQSLRKPKLIDFEISPLGIKIGLERYQMKELKSFWIEYEPELRINELSLQRKKWLSTYLKLPLGKTNPLQVRQILIKFIPEQEHGETFTETLVKKIGL